MIINLGHSEKLLLQKGLMLFEFKALNLNNELVFAFLLMGKGDLAKFETDLKSLPEINYHDYGTVSYSGSGIPTDDDRQMAIDCGIELVKISQN